jgi:hypothetical protein
MSYEITNIYGAFHNVLRDYKHLSQENQRTYLNGIVHSHRKTGSFFLWPLEMFDVCTTGYMAHMDTIFKFLGFYIMSKKPTVLTLKYIIFNIAVLQKVIRILTC